MYYFSLVGFYKLQSAPVCEQYYIYRRAFHVLTFFGKLRFTSGGRQNTNPIHHPIPARLNAWVIFFLISSTRLYFLTPATIYIFHTRTINPYSISKMWLNDHKCWWTIKLVYRVMSIVKMTWHVYLLYIYIQPRDFCGPWVRPLTQSAPGMPYDGWSFALKLYWTSLYM